MSDFGNVTEISDYYSDYYESEWEVLEDEEEEEMEDEEEEMKEPEEVDIFADLLKDFRHSVAEKKLAKVTAEKDLLHKLIGVISFW